MESYQIKYNVVGLTKGSSNERKLKFNQNLIRYTLTSYRFSKSIQPLEPF